MDVKLKTSLAVRDVSTGKMTIGHAGDVMSLEDTLAQRMIRMDLAEPITRRGRKRQDGK